MSDTLAGILAEDTPLILDGGLATELEALGADLSGDLWSACLLDSAPELIITAHQRYFDAGARVAISANYQATLEGFKAQGFSEDRATALLKLAVELADDARRRQQHADQLLVAASIGPYGAFLADGSEYRGNYGVSTQVLREFHEPRWRLLSDTAADCFACETIPCIEEALALTELAQKHRKPYWLCFSCCDGNHLSDGTDIESAVEQVISTPAPPFAIGVNCTSPLFIVSLVKRIHGRLLTLNASKTKLLVYPNSGEHYDASNNSWHGQAELAHFVAAAADWVEAGANWIGGCCRTSPDHIRALAMHFAPASIAESRN